MDIQWPEGVGSMKQEDWTDRLRGLYFDLTAHLRLLKLAELNC